MRSGLINRKSDFIEARHLEDPEAGVVVYVVVREVGDDLTQNDDVIERHPIPGEVITVYRHLLIRRGLTTCK